jgi:hypothetical protein
LNQYFALTPDLESMLLAWARKIVLQHNLPTADILYAPNEDDERDVRALAVSAVLSIEGRQDLQCGLFVLLQRGRELSDERLHEKRVVARHNA